MSDFSQGDGWWQASDGKWYAPEQASGYQPPPGPYGAPGPYPAGGYGYPMGPPVAPRTDPMAIVALCLGIGGTLFGLLCCIGIVATIAAIVLGLRSKKKIAASGGALTGEGMAQAGFIIGIVGTALIVLATGALVALRS